MAGQRSSSLIDVDASGFLQDVEAAFADMGKRSRKGLKRVALDVQNRARQLSPVDTGRLRSSIGILQEGEDGHTYFIDVGTNVEYAEFVEFGTSSHKPQPFLRPALAEASGGEFATILGKGGR